MEKITAKTPWEEYTCGVPMHLDYFEGSMFDAVKKISEQYPRNIAFPSSVEVIGFFRRTQITVI